MTPEQGFAVVAICALVYFGFREIHRAVHGTSHSKDEHPKR